ncbi:MAG: ATP-binding protein, partial [Halobacteria archaeon]|nr:ATP-binding protein [Halobacteria archaeon]
EKSRDRFGVDIEVVKEDISPVYAIEGISLALENLIENAVVHNDNDDDIKVEVRTYSEDNWLYIEVNDNGSGIHESEIEVIEKGEEEDLKHGSGMGLWAIKWIVQKSRGNIEFGESRFGGTSVKLSLRECDTSDV